MTPNKDENKYPESELTSKIIGCAFDVFKELGYGLPERIYQSALATAFEKSNIKYSREKYGFITFKGEKIGKYYLDFLVENRVAVELKVRNDTYTKDVNQLLNYMESENLKIGLLLTIGKDGVKIKRLIN